MHRLYLIFTKKRIKRLLLLFWATLLILSWLFIIFITGATGDDGPDSWLTIIFWFGGIISILLFYIQLIVICIYIQKYVKNKSLFFIFYFLFFIFYFLFFIFYFLNAVDFIYSIFPIMFLFFIFRMKNKRLIILKRYGFAILLAISTLILHLTRIYFINLDIPSGSYSKNTIDIYYHFFHTPKVFYWSEIYLLTFVFFIIQLGIEVYHFYKREKPKWIRFERIKGDSCHL